jgi:outer membrane protein assembly factor BamB/tetratricopeptide (TPR) repeat protein
MGFQGQLSSVQLADLFQTIFMNRQTGTLSVEDPGGTVHVYFEQGQIALATAPLVDGVPFLLNTVMRKGLIPADRVGELNQRLRSSGQPLRELFRSSGFITEQDLDEIAIWCVEEVVCPLFELPDGNFTFTDGEPIDPLMAPDVLELGVNRLPTQQIIMEATRRKDEWRRIREIIPDSTVLFVVDNDGRTNLRNIQTDPEMLKVLRYLDGRHTLDSIANAVGATRFDTHAIVGQMVLSGVARPQSAQDVVTDAMALKETGELAKARELLEHALTQTRLPEVMRPLAEVCSQLGQAARAVELYLELIQISQDQGNLDQALADLDTVIGLSPDDPELHFERAQVRAEMGQVEEAAAGYVIAAQAFLGTKDVARALDACHRAKNLLPRSPEPHRYLARAYLMEGQTENATVEYKSLWHSLLTTLRPRRALEELRTILDADCKFAAIKEQVLQHAQNSEAVKTSKAMRALVYVIAAAVIVACSVVGWEYYNHVILRGKGQDELARIEGSLNRKLESIEHPKLIEELDKLRTRFGADSELRPAIDALAEKVKGDFEARGQGVLSRGKALLDGGDFAQSERSFQELVRQYEGTSAAANAPALLEQVRQARITAQVQAELAEASRRWQALDWDGALVAIGKVLERKDLPNALRAKLTEQQVGWAAANRSAQQLCDRAARIEQSGDLRAAIIAYRRATNGEGEQYVGIARDHLRAIELTYAQVIGKQLTAAAITGDDAKTFAAYDDLVRLAGESSGDGVRSWLSGFDIPFTLQLDHPGTLLVIRRPSGETQVRAPQGTTGVWNHRFTYHPGETVTVIAGRAGYANQTGSVSVANRRAAASVQLVRGPRWKVDLTGPATTPPVLAQGQLLIGTGKATLEVVDPRQGSSRAITFPDTVAEFRTPPVIFQDRAYIVIEDTLFALDLSTRSRIWSWTGHLTGSLWVQEHDLIQGTLLMVAGSSRDGVTLIGADAAGHITRYPFKGENELTGQPGADHPANRTLLYLPFGSELLVVDATATAENSGPVPLYSFRSRGDLVGRPTRVTVGPNKRPAMLIGDNSGLMLAIDADPNTPDTKRATGTWPIDGTQPSTPLIDGRTAYVMTGEGRLHAIDLDNPGQLRWKYPAQGGLGSTPGQPAIGRKGLYIATASGTLISLDRASGRERWRCDLGAPATGVVTADGMVFVPLRNGQLLGFEEGNDPE